jgi:uncharacterized membrane protein YfcA
MEMITSLMDPWAFALALSVAFIAGIVKGMVGFAMPMILISGLSTVISPELALAGLILPTLATNGLQALRQGWRAALESLLRFKGYLGTLLVVLLISAQLVRVIPADVLLLIIGVPIVLFAATQLAGIPLRIASPSSRVVEISIGAFAGFIGGLSGVWGPPTVAYLTALDTPKADHIRVQGVIYGLGAFVLLFAHIGSGVVRTETIPFSLALLVPAFVGMWLGLKVNDRIDQKVFRKATLFVLFFVGLNLIRRGLT